MASLLRGRVIYNKHFTRTAGKWYSIWKVFWPENKDYYDLKTRSHMHMLRNFRGKDLPRTITFFEVHNCFTRCNGFDTSFGLSMSWLPKIFFSLVPEKFPHSKGWTNDALKGQTKSAINIQWGKLVYAKEKGTLFYYIDCKNAWSNIWVAYQMKELIYYLASPIDCQCNGEK